MWKNDNAVFGGALGCIWAVAIMLKLISIKREIMVVVLVAAAVKTCGCAVLQHMASYQIRNCQKLSAS